MKQALKTVIFGMAALIATPALGQIETERTIMVPTTAFDPAPGHFTPEQMQKIEDVARAVWAKNHLMPSVDPVTIKDVKAWPKQNGDGFIVCATFPASKVPEHGPQVDITAALSINGGKFPGYQVQNLFDEQAYNLVGCNTPGATAG